MCRSWDCFYDTKRISQECRKLIGLLNPHGSVTFAISQKCIHLKKNSGRWYRGGLDLPTKYFSNASLSTVPYEYMHSLLP